MKSFKCEKVYFKLDAVFDRKPMQAFTSRCDTSKTGSTSYNATYLDDDEFWKNHECGKSKKSILKTHVWRS